MSRGVCGGVLCECSGGKGLRRSCEDSAREIVKVAALATVLGMALAVLRGV